MKNLLKRIAIISIVFNLSCDASVNVDHEARTPTLGEIVSLDSGQQLNPTFSPGINRYSIVSDIGSDGISLTVSASNPEDILSFNNRTIAANSTIHENSLDYGETVVIRVTDNQGNTANYEIVYLPPDFPKIKTTYLHSSASEDWLYMDLFNPQTNVSFATILDNFGVPIFYTREPETLIFDFKYHETSGERSYARLKKSANIWNDRDFEQIILSADNEVAEVVTTVGLSQTDNHDFHILPGNELLLLSYDSVPYDLSPYELENYIDESVIQIIDRTSRKVKFEWRSLEEIPFESQLYEPLRNEYAHINSAVIDWDGNILASLSGTSEVIKIDRATGQLLWRFGGLQNQFSIDNDPYIGTCGQHDVSRLENGNLLIFDNGRYCLPYIGREQFTRVVEYEIDEVNRDAKLVWSYSRDDFYSTSLGSAERLSNGNTLIGWGRGPDVLLTEVDSNNTKVLEMKMLSSGYLNYRIRRFAE